MDHQTNPEIMRLILCTILFFTAYQAFSQKKIIVSAKGDGDFKTIQGAINSLTDDSKTDRTIFIKNGIYREKIYLEKHHIILEGESKEKTIITNSISRDEWRCLHNEDWGVATLNLDGNDITLKNLSIINSYGADTKNDKTIFCATDTGITRNKVIKPGSHQMALRTNNTTRLKAINCLFRAFGGDTVSPWNVEFGMFYFKDCDMEGGVDFYCPRGWAYAEGCTFTAKMGDAAIWHDGSKIEDAKTVLVNCTFKGYDGFKLGRYHRDAQFFLIDCVFANNMADKEIYLVPTNNKIQWGKRIYYSNCHRKNGDYAWFKDNLASFDKKLNSKNITTNWLFGKRWDPVKN